MEAVYIPQLLYAPEKTEIFEIQQFLEHLETLTPVRGKLSVTHGGTYLQVGMKAETIVTLTCDRCLQQYNHRLSVEAKEVIWLDENANEPYTGPLEREVSLEDLSETVSPSGHFQAEEWIYEQMSLALPHRQLCSQQCPGIPAENLSGMPQIDSRWASLEALKKQLPSEK